MHGIAIFSFSEAGIEKGKMLDHEEHTRPWWKEQENTEFVSRSDTQPWNVMCDA